MIKIILIGVWSCAVALSANWAAVWWTTREAKTAAAAEAARPGLELKKAKPLNVPIIANGAVQGYIVAQLSYMVDSKAFASSAVPPEPFLLDEAFRMIYADEKLNFKQLERYDLDRLTKTVLTRVRERMKSDMVQDIVIQEFNFVSKSDIRQDAPR